MPYESGNGDRNKKKNAGAIGIYWTGASQPLLLTPGGFPEMQAGKKEPGRSTDPLTLDKRYHFFPQLNLFLTIPPTNDKIVARAFNIRQLLDEKGIDYLYVTSFPPLGKVSASYHYQLEVASHAGSITYALQAGPSGLTISKDGRVEWKPPAQPADETVIVSLKDASGQELLHSFHVVTVP
ncbi:MAG: hypothetical protein WDN28_16925 [Chthoniobacter sp.]